VLSNEDKSSSAIGRELWSEEDLRGAPPPAIRSDDIIAGMTAVQMRAAAAIFAGLLACFAVTGLALGDFNAQPDPIISDCSHVSDPTKRLACFDRLAAEVQRPFKGGAPFDNLEQ
jgi:hypothetical protein